MPSGVGGSGADGTRPPPHSPVAEQAGRVILRFMAAGAVAWGGLVPEQAAALIDEDAASLSRLLVELEPLTGRTGARPDVSVVLPIRQLGGRVKLANCFLFSHGIKTHRTQRNFISSHVRERAYGEMKGGLLPLVASLKSSFEFCDTALAKTDDSKLGDMVEMFGGRQVPRAFAFIALASSWADHYGATAMYLRLNGILPPTAQKKTEEKKEEPKK